MRAATIALGLGLVALGAASCDRCGSSRSETSCAAPRQRDNGSCCPPWSRAEGSSCAPRAWSEGVTPLAGEHGALALALDDRGLGIVVTTRARPGHVGAVLAEERAAGQWLSVPIATEPGNATDLMVAAGGQGVAVASWRQIGGSGEIRYVYRHGGSWSDGGVASFPPDAYHPSAAVGPDGEALLVWNQRRPDKVLGVGYARLAPGGERFERPTGVDDVLSMPINFSNTPEIAMNDRGQAVITWFQGIGGMLRMFVSERAGQGQPFSHPTKDDPLSLDSDHPEGEGGHFLGENVAAVAPDGRVAVAWTQPNERGATCVYLATRTAAGVWTRQRSLEDSLSAPRGHAYWPRLAFAPSGDLFVLWRRAEADRSVVELAHRTADERWSETIALSDEQALAFEPRIVAGRDGGVVATWVEQSAGRARLVARRSSTDREPGHELEAWGSASELARGKTQGNYAVALASGGPRERVLAGWVIGEELQVFSID